MFWWGLDERWQQLVGSQESGINAKFQKTMGWLLQGSHVEVQMQNIGENVTFPTIYEDLPYIKAYQFNHWTRAFNTFFF